MMTKKEQNIMDYIFIFVSFPLMWIGFVIFGFFNSSGNVILRVLFLLFVGFMMSALLNVVFLQFIHYGEEGWS